MLSSGSSRVPDPHLGILASRQNAYPVSKPASYQFFGFFSPFFSWNQAHCLCFLSSGSDNIEASYTIVTILEWDTKQALQTALATPAGKEIVADQLNFSNKTPVMFAGDVVAGFGTLALQRGK